MTTLVFRDRRRASSVRRMLRSAFLILLFYLLQSCVVPHLKVMGVMPNLLMVIIAVLTVSCGRKYAFVAGASIGIVLESMSPNLTLFYVLVYPTLALLCAQAFADMSDIKREMLRIRIAQQQAESGNAILNPYKRKKLFRRLRRTSPDDLNPHVRIVLNALTLVVLYEGIMLIYIALDGVAVGGTHILRIIVTLAYTFFACVLLMFPARWFLGMYRKKKDSVIIDKVVHEVVDLSEEELRKIAIVPNVPDDAALTHVADGKRGIMVKGDEEGTDGADSQPESGLDGGRKQPSDVDSDMTDKPAEGEEHEH